MAIPCYKGKEAMTKFEALKAALQKLGGQTALGKICGKSQNAVWKWENQTKELPIQHCREVERATGIPAHYFQPAHFDPPLPDNISGQWADENGNMWPILDKDIHDDMPANQSKNEVAA